MKIRSNKRKPWTAKKAGLVHHAKIQGLLLDSPYIPAKMHCYKKRIIRGWRPCLWILDGGTPSSCKTDCPSAGMYIVTGIKRRMVECPNRMRGGGLAWYVWRPIAASVPEPVQTLSSRKV
jgi:hypothetical protein